MYQYSYIMVNISHVMKHNKNILNQHIWSGEKREMELKEHMHAK